MPPSLSPIPDSNPTASPQKHTSNEMHSQMEEVQEQPTDPDWSELHRDVLLVIFDKIKTVEVLKSACTCKSWRMASREPECWRTIDMTNHGYKSGAFLLIDPTMLAIDLSHGRVEEFSIEAFGDDNLLQFLCDRTSVLKCLRLISCYFISEKGLAATIKKQPKLEEIQIAFGPFSNKVTEIVGMEAPQLKRFKFNALCMYPITGEVDEEDLSFDVAALGIAKTMHQLRHLQLTYNSITNRGLKAILEGCPHLETLDIRGCCNVSMDYDMWSLCARLTCLRQPNDSLDDYEFRDKLDDSGWHIDSVHGGSDYTDDGYIYESKSSNYDDASTDDNKSSNYGGIYDDADS
ncbi:RNI-like superfamily protein [Rhynchospora pubera]|uniref:RNI-like superfamily protein n=1 Tax=Rhynchospora pubera TaxID=906938 RepID=A0AAV8FKK3_9POAL|nr:RNI-like superfamily protein [Rhynchospora pubera]